MARNKGLALYHDADLVEVKAAEQPRLTTRRGGACWDHATGTIDDNPVTFYQEMSWGTRVYFQRPGRKGWYSLDAFKYPINSGVRLEFATYPMVAW